MNSFDYNGTVNLDVTINVTSDIEGLVLFEAINRTMMTDDDIYFQYYWFYPDHLANYTIVVDYYIDGVLADSTTHDYQLEFAPTWVGADYKNIHSNIYFYDYDEDENSTNDAYRFYLRPYSVSWIEQTGSINLQRLFLIMVLQILLSNIERHTHQPPHIICLCLKTLL